MRTYTFPERRPPAGGPWDDEPDKAQWIDEATGLDCLIVRNHFGALCGYVGVPPSHPWHGKDYDDVDAFAHGGLTFAGACQEGAEDGPGICHVPEPGRPADVWWLGFDCGHYMDLSPGMLDSLPSDLREQIEAHQTYRTFDYVRGEVAGLAVQAAAAASHPSEEHDHES
ncbi:MAG TPA: hypothetical protein VE326_11300 [Candidatus Binatia bacterium]|nr:hypothetical protein [Candidatus Binatia bacterium]